jgi:phosphoglycerate dehydrogenase-like enzyme
MKKKQFKIDVKRIGKSPYFEKNFIENEKNSLEKILGVNYTYEENSNIAEIIITNTHVQLDQSHLNFFANTKLIIHPNSGYDNFSYSFVDNFKGSIIVGNEIRKQAVSNYILSCLLKHYSPINNELTWDLKRTWKRELLKDKTILIVGLGNIGQLLYTSLINLVKEIKIYDPFNGHPHLNLENVDIIIPVCGLNPTSKHLINEDFLNRLSPKTLIINASRGEIINTSNLIAFLTKNPESFAYLDVFEEEPNNFTEFNSIKNINLTSHIAGVFSKIDVATINFESSIVYDYIHSPDQFDEKYFTSNLKNKRHNNFII